MKKLILAVSLAMIAAGAAQAGPPAPKAHGIEDKIVQMERPGGRKDGGLEAQGRQGAW
jgi:hypothetical protein